MKIIKSFLFSVVFLASAACSDSNKDKIVRFETSEGIIRVKLYNETPLHRDNFLKLVKEGYYNGLLFHRVIDNFMIQTGDVNSRNAAPGAALGSGDVGYTIEPEIVPGLFHKRGVLAAARQGDAINPERRSSGAQFYIVKGVKYDAGKLAEELERSNSFRKDRDSLVLTEEQIKAYTTIGGTPHLDGLYTVFGEVIQGMKVVDRISALKTDKRNRPYKDVVIEVAYIE